MTNNVELARLLEGGVGTHGGTPETFAETDVEPGHGLTVSPADVSSDYLLIQTFSVEQSADVYQETDIDGDGEFDASVRIERFEAAGISQKNAVPLSTKPLSRLRVVNTGQSAGDIIVTGSKID